MKVGDTYPRSGELQSANIYRFVTFEDHIGESEDLLISGDTYRWKSENVSIDGVG